MEWSFGGRLPRRDARFQRPSARHKAQNAEGKYQEEEKEEIRRTGQHQRENECPEMREKREGERTRRG